MTHSHDTATPALSVESKYVLVPREPTPEMVRSGEKAYFAIPADRDGPAMEDVIYRAMLDAAPAPNPSPAAKGGEAEARFDYLSDAQARELFGTEDDDELPDGRVRVCAGEWVRIPGGYYFDASAGLLHPETASEACDGCEVTIALATPSSQPADAVREAAQAYIEAQDAEPENDCWDTESGEAKEGAEKFASDWAWADYHERVQEARNTLRAALASDPAPSGEAVEPVGRELDRQRKRADHNADLYWAMRERAEAAEAALTATQTPTHSDDLAVDRFAAAMKSKLANKRKEGRGGWDDPVRCSAAVLSRLLHEHVEKGDPLDVGNLAMMLHQRGESIINPAPEDTARLRKALEEAALWHDAQDKAMSKQPNANVGNNGWMRNEHQEQARSLRAALATEASR